MVFFFFFKHKTAYEMRISDWSSDVCSSDLGLEEAMRRALEHEAGEPPRGERAGVDADAVVEDLGPLADRMAVHDDTAVVALVAQDGLADPEQAFRRLLRQRLARPDAGMPEQIVPLDSRRPQGLQAAEARGK